MPKYTVTKIDKLGEYDQKYGQRWWGKIDEAEMPVSFNLMDNTISDIPAGMPIEYEERKLKTSAKGNDYMHLTKVKLLGTPSTAPQPKDTKQELLELTYENTQEILKILKASEIPVIEDAPQDVFPD